MTESVETGRAVVTEALRTGACVAWPLSADEGCAALARGLVREVTRDLGLAADRVDDATTMASELATNALLHGGGRVRHRDGRPVAGLPELWVYPRAAAPRELVCTLFDAGDGWAGVRVPEPGETDADGLTGRGLQVVAALAAEAGGRWGRHPSRARLGEECVPGTAVWFALPLPPTVPADVRIDPTPAAAMGRLAELLRSRGLRHLYGQVTGDRAVLSVRRDLTVWYRHGIFFWSTPDGGGQRAACTDAIDAAERILAAYETAGSIRSKSSTWS